jgi:hypothetical protein
MVYAHRDKTPLPLQGMRGPRLQDTVAALPWHASKSDGDTPLYQRVLGIFAGQ